VIAPSAAACLASSGKFIVIGSPSASTVADTYGLKRVYLALPTISP